ncbi:peptidoglycan-binding protein [Chlorogloeopsis sp. ULAP01]|uniref:peptidoglycan-binding domain-containing protein n=1 Tax=Chlorogloeopsis sp. ULAP01 TaxID=3056483 RepID=UPI0025AB5442|nr:peptidoglycan-binding protein [Chlorogloeopsis sp. ULAP01]MDM9385487.1 peptidoglycan-binding protein [Chlorogloeopsis sp. ULAP01]
MAVTITVFNFAGQALALQRGDSSSEVSNLQRCLQSLGYFQGPINGNFGVLTEEAVKKFQRANNIGTTGIVGAQTQQALQYVCQNGQSRQSYTFSNTSDRFSYNLSEGDAGPEVSELQRKLQQLGYFKGNPTGYFGTTTTNAVILFQQHNQLPPSGIADPQTLAQISRAMGSPNSACSINSGYICLGEKSSRVSTVQQRLRQLGFFTEEITGYYGATTRNAVAQFQRDAGMYPTGNVDFSTWQRLGLGSNNPPTAINNPTPANRNRYVVVVPIRRADTLPRVRQYIPKAFAARSKLGHYVNAGTFRDRSEAEKHSQFLRELGFDARVEYF